MHKAFFKILCTAAFCVIFFLNSSEGSRAYNIEPAIREFILETEEQKKSSIYFTNSSDETQEFKAYSHRYNPKTETILDERDFTKLDKDFFVLEPGEKVEIGYEITIPEDVLAGSYFSIIVVEKIQDQITEPTAIAINYGIGSLVAIHIVDDTDISEVFLNQTAVNLTYKKPLNPLKTEITYSIKNNSKYTFLPKGQLVIISKGKEPIHYQINTAETKLYPEEVLSFQFEYEGEWKDLLSNKKIISRIGSQFSNDLREIQTELPYLGQTLTAITIFLSLIVVTVTILIRRKKKLKKAKKK